MMPRRLQRRRTKGWRKPEWAVIVDRTSRWGNIYSVRRKWYLDSKEWVIVWECAPGAQEYYVLYEKLSPKARGYGENWTKEQAIGKIVELFHNYAIDRLEREPDWLDPLRGKDLLCTCGVGEICHGDVLLELANRRR